MIRLLLLLAFVCVSGSMAHAAAITTTLGVAVDPTRPPTPPCSTFGFSIDATNTLPTGQNNIRMLRVDRTGTTNFGYAITSQTGAGYTVYLFNTRTMAVLGSVVHRITGYSDAGRLQGEIASDYKLYLFHEVDNTNPGCANSNCLVMARWNLLTLEATGVDAVGARIDNVDDAREMGSNFLVVVSRGTAPLVREFRTYNKSSLSFIAAGTQGAIATFTRISRPLNGVLYAHDESGSPNTYRFTGSSPTATATTTLNFSAPLLTSAIFPASAITGFTDQFVFDSNVSGASTPERSYITPPATIVGPQGFSGGNADLGASFQGTFWDATNQRVFALRTDGAGSGTAQRTTLGFSSPFTTEQNFACASCVNSGGQASGSQIVDYSPARARLYVGSNESPARVTRIKVCATGGPP